MRSLLVISLGIVSSAISLGGCEASPTADRRAEAPLIAQDPALDAQSVGAEQNADSSKIAPPDPLVEKTQTYAEQMAELIERRTNAPKSTDAVPASPPVEEQSPARPTKSPLKTEPMKPGDSGVKWPEPARPAVPAIAPDAPSVAAPDDAPIPPEPTTETPQPSETKPSVDVQIPKDADAKRIASLDHASPEMPAIVPEGSERSDATPQLSQVEDGIQPLADRLAQKIKDNPRDVAAHLDYQLLLYLRQEPTPDLSLLAPLPSEDRELVAATVDGLSNLRSNLQADNNQLLSKKIKPLVDTATRLQSQAELSVSTIALCKRVDGFGVYEPIDPPRFIAGKEQAVIVYCEVQNFSSNQNDRKFWETKMLQEAVLYTETGLPVWQDKPAQIVDTSRNRRKDFFVVRMIKLPASLTIGRYVLKVTVVDQQAARVAEATAPIQVVAQ